MGELLGFVLLVTLALCGCAAQNTTTPLTTPSPELTLNSTTPPIFNHTSATVLCEAGIYGECWNFNFHMNHFNGT